MRITLRRITQSNFGTFGMLLDEDGEPLCFTCEEPWKGNAPRVSCIPPGPNSPSARYECGPHDTERFPGVWAVTGVPGRTAILIHAGNTIKDTQGCILVGTSFLRNPDYSVYGVADSRRALNRLRDLLPDYFTLTVEAAPATEKSRITIDAENILHTAMVRGADE